jgi:hypothetical protein
MSQDVSAPIQRDPDDQLARIDPLLDRPAWMADAVPEIGTPAQAMPVPPTCAICQGARWIKEAVPLGQIVVSQARVPAWPVRADLHPAWLACSASSSRAEYRGWRAAGNLPVFGRFPSRTHQAQAQSP